MTRRKTLSQIAAENIPRKGTPCWELLLSPEMAAELEQAYQDFKAGTRGTRTGFCTAMSIALQECGQRIGAAGVSGWLSRREKALVPELPPNSRSQSPPKTPSRSRKESTAT